MRSVFYPKKSFIESISQGMETVVTFTEDCDFTPGEVVSFRVSKENGMSELNNAQAIVISSTADTITIGIDSINFTPFVFTEEYEGTFPAMVIPAGSGIVPGSYPPSTSLVDAFDNIPLN